MRFSIVCVFLLVASFGFAQPGAAGPFDFAIIQPGAPGNATDAAPFMQLLARYIADRGQVKPPPVGTYVNRTEDGMALLADKPPAWGIVSLGFYLKFEKRYSMHPFASTRPSGKEKDRWRLLVRSDGPEDWRKLSGTVRGSVLSAGRDTAALHLFGTELKKLPFRLEGSSRPLSATRDVIRGRSAGVIVDGPQFETLGRMGRLESLKVIAASAPLPTSPVVWFGTPDATAETLRGTLMGMREDPAAADLLKLLRTDGFGPADTGLKKPVLPPVSTKTDR